MALSAAAVYTGAQLAFMLAGKVLVQAISAAHKNRQRELQLVIQLQGKLHDRCTSSSKPYNSHPALISDLSNF